MHLKKRSVKCTGVDTMAELISSAFRPSLRKLVAIFESLQRKWYCRVRSTLD